MYTPGEEGSQLPQRNVPETEGDSTWLKQQMNVKK